MSHLHHIRRQQIQRHAEGYLELGMAHHALAELDQLEGGSLSGYACYLRGEALRSLERWDDAARWLEQSAHETPDNIRVWLALGWCYKRTRRLGRAIDALESALAVDPSEAIIHYNLACYWSLARNKSRALDYLAQAFEIDSNYRDMVHSEPDFDPIRDDPDFRALTSVVV